MKTETTTDCTPDVKYDIRGSDTYPFFIDALVNGPPRVFPGKMTRLPVGVESIRVNEVLIWREPGFKEWRRDRVPYIDNVRNLSGVFYHKGDAGIQEGSRIRALLNLSGIHPGFEDLHPDVIQVLDEKGEAVRTLRSF
tara:strand:+ start:498 stop:911 length:414 start_codon:yes stop_codon:yes gene_type:complete